MKVNTVDTVYLSNLKNQRTRRITEPTTTASPPVMNMLAFKSGNPRHIAHVIVEEPIFGLKGGGVGTVSHDYNFLDKDVDRITKLIPLYNCDVDYKVGKNGELFQDGVKIRKIPSGLASDHPFKAYEGQPFFTSLPIQKGTNLADFLKDKADDVFVLDEVKTSTMSWGLEKETPNGMYVAKKTPQLDKALKKHLAGDYDRLKDKLEFVFTFVDGTGSMEKPYQDGSYASATGSELAKRYSQSWSGQPYAKYDKAMVELLPALKEKTGTDPKYILCSDSQTMFTIHYAAQKNAAKDPYWADKFLGAVGHNLNAGYLQETGPRNTIVNLGATPEEINKIVKSKAYIDATLNNREDQFLKETVLKNFHDANGNLHSFLVPVHYGKKGYLPTFSTVSEGYYKAVIENPEISPALYADLKELDKLGVFRGITNPLNDPKLTGFSLDGLVPGYKLDTKLQLKDGKEVTLPGYTKFDEAKGLDLKHIREIKRQNKMNFFERLSGKYEGAKLWDAKNSKWLAEGTGLSQITAGLANKNPKIHGYVDPKYIEKLKKGEDVKLVVSWGRGDFQKAIDVVMDSFDKFVKNTGNTDTVLVLGGPIEHEDARKVLEKAKGLVNNDKYKGRVVFFEGFAPNTAFVSPADVALLPSRFAPCELTDLEAKKYFCTPIVPNCEGMAQKNFDPLVDAAKMDAYKGKHAYFMSEKEAYEAANAEAKQAFDSVKNAVTEELKTPYKRHSGKEMPADLLEKSLKGDKNYQAALKALRDSVISDEMAECLERALIKDRNGNIPETILKNHVQNSTKWTENAWLSSINKSSAELYEELHFSKKGKNISESDLIKLDLSELGESVSEKGSKSVGSKVKEILGKKSTKWSIAGVAALTAAYGIYRLLGAKKAKAIDPISEKPLVIKPAVNTKNIETTGHLSTVC
ncbi:MAG: hypothetical protein E7Z89_07680 [Cyanobacteria bacterium SIG28]|nr:hypothetical protein [Cyanobacteria bacterium SIG28]